MKGVTESIVETALYVPGQTRSIDVDLSGYVTQIIVSVGLNITAPSGAAAITDGLLKMIRGLKFTASNAKDWYSVRQGIEGFYLAYLKSQGQCFLDAITGLEDADDRNLQFTIHPGNLFGRQYDVTRSIPLRGKSNVEMQITWGTPATHLGTGWTVDADESDGLSIIVSRVILEPGESEADAFAPLDYLMVPRLVPVTYQIDAVYDAFGFSQNIPTGGYVRDIGLLTLDSDEERSRVEVEAMRVYKNDGTIPFVRRNWIAYERETRAKLYLPASIAGLSWINLKDISGKDYGLNMVGASLGDWKLEWTTLTNDGQIRALYEMADMESVDPTVVGM